jgi:hypothetical protein
VSLLDYMDVYVFCHGMPVMSPPQGVPVSLIVFKVVFAFIVTRCPRSSLANEAMTELDKGCSLVEEAAKDNRRAAKALVSIVISRSYSNV